MDYRKQLEAMGNNPTPTLEYRLEDYPLEEFPYGPAGSMLTQEQHDKIGDLLTENLGRQATFGDVNKAVNESRGNINFIESDEPAENFMRKSTDKIFDVINSPAGKAFLPGAQMINIIDRLIDNAITDEELEEATSGYKK